MPPGKQQKPSNPYSAAAGAYGDHAQKHTPDQRELEARVLLKSANFLHDLQKDWDNVSSEVLHETLKYNRQIWLMFYDTAMDNPEGNRPSDLRSNIINLANFIFKREMEIITRPEKGKLDVLININREIAAGLLAGAAADSKAGRTMPAEDKKIPPGGGTSTTA